MPFDPKREFVRCVLCDAEPTTREHLFGDSLARTLNIPINAVGIGRGVGGEPKELNSGSPFLSSVSKCLCSECNNVRFHSMMGRAQPVIAALAKGQKTSISPQEGDDLVFYFERLGILVDVLSSNYQLSDAHKESKHFAPHASWHLLPPVYTLDERKAWVTRKPIVERPRVFVGRHRGVLGLNPEANCTRQATLKAGDAPIEVVGRQYQVCIGQLAVEIRMGVEVGRQMPSDAFVQLRPSAAPLNWPAARDVGYDDFLALFAQDPPTLFLRRIFQNVVTRIVEEERWRRRHTSAVRAAKAQRAEASKKSKAAAKAKKERKPNREH